MMSELLIAKNLKHSSLNLMSMSCFLGHERPVAAQMGLKAGYSIDIHWVDRFTNKKWDLADR